jgi:hypothetical protein
MVFSRGTSGSTWGSRTYNHWHREEAVMPEPPYRALRIVLRVFSLLAALGGLLMIFAEKPLIVRIFLRPPEGEVTTLLLSLLKEMGGIVLMLSVLLWLASRNPMRNVAIVDGFIAGLCILAVIPVLSLWMTDIRSVYPAYLLWGRSCRHAGGLSHSQCGRDRPRSSREMKSYETLMRIQRVVAQRIRSLYAGWSNSSEMVRPVCIVLLFLLCEGCARPPCASSSARPGSSPSVGCSMDQHLRSGRILLQVLRPARKQFSLGSWGPAGVQCREFFSRPVRIPSRCSRNNVIV